MTAAFRKLGWTPYVFWSATPLELAAALGLSEHGGSLSKADLAQLMRDFPD
ncbi:phage tail assembly chaperone [Roseibium sp.]|uniref:phage tail assembly chaperone n=1 Tax=Roseibium sp. TaxID=1936156 RepID=UPI003A986B1B